VTSTLVDSNVLLDVITQDGMWFPWSSDALAAAADRGALVLNSIIYAEVSVGFARIEDVETVLPTADFRREAIPWEAVFLAAKTHLRYRQRGGARSSTLPDFFVGGHAAVSGHDLLTRDASRYRTYFPRVRTISP
jgi:predicted nucleic acid-binding protein